MEYVPSTQCEKWRLYARTRKRGTDGPTRVDVA
jgi:hypothetical protein